MRLTCMVALLLAGCAPPPATPGPTEMDGLRSRVGRSRTDLESRFRLAAGLWAQGDRAGAETFLREAAAESPEEPLYVAALGAITEADGGYANAREAYLEFLGRSEGSGVTRAVEERLHLMRGETAATLAREAMVRGTPVAHGVDTAQAVVLLPLRAPQDPDLAGLAAAITELLSLDLESRPPFRVLSWETTAALARALSPAPATEADARALGMVLGAHRVVRGEIRRAPGDSLVVDLEASIVDGDRIIPITRDSVLVPLDSYGESRGAVTERTREILVGGGPLTLPTGYFGRSDAVSTDALQSMGEGLLLAESGDRPVARAMLERGPGRGARPRAVTGPRSAAGGPRRPAELTDSSPVGGTRAHGTPGRGASVAAAVRARRTFGQWSFPAGRRGGLRPGSPRGADAGRHHHSVGARPLMRSIAGAWWTWLVLCLPASAQELVLTNATAGFTFSKPAEVGVRHYSMGATKLGLSWPVGERLAGGVIVGHVRGSMDVQSSKIRHSGWTDAEIFARARVGPVSIRGGASLDAGSASGSSSMNALVGLAAYDVLPFPARSWGRGGGFSLDGAVPFRVRGLEIQVAGGWRTHGAYPPFDDDAFEYHLGSERRVSLHLGRQTSALSRIDVGAAWVSPAPDRATRDAPFSADEPVFDPGRRFDLYSVIQSAVGRTSALFRADIYSRGQGSLAPSPSYPSTLVEGLSTSSHASLVIIQLETRTVAHPVPILVSAAMRSALPIG